MSFPSLYHAHHLEYTVDLPFWLELAVQQEGPVLELGCGTGRVLSALAQMGFPAFGLDNDYAMLHFLLHNLPTGLSHLPHVFLADMAAFQLAKRFPLILLPCNTMSIFSPDVVLSILSNVRHHLTSDGLFATSIPNPSLLKMMPPEAESELEEVFLLPESEDPVQVSSSWERTTHSFRVWWHYDRLKPDGSVHRLTVEAVHSLAPLSFYRQAFHQAGLHLVSHYGGFSRQPYQAKSPHLIMVAEVP